MDLPTFRQKIAVLIQDDAGVLEAVELDALIDSAVRRYSRAKPRVVVADAAGDGGFDYDLPAQFDPEWSELRRVEYPAGRREPSYVDKLDWTLYEDPTGVKLRFLADSPKAGETIRLTFTALHTVDASSTTVPAADHDVIELLGAALACEALASHYSSAGDSTVLADRVDHKSKAAEYALRAKRFAKLAEDLVPLPDKDDVRPAGAETSFGGDAGFLTHPER